METRPRLKVSSDRLVEPRIEPATPGLQGKWLIHYNTAAPQETIIAMRVILSVRGQIVKMIITGREHFYQLINCLNALDTLFIADMAVNGSFRYLFTAVML